MSNGMIPSRNEERFVLELLGGQLTSACDQTTNGVAEPIPDQNNSQNWPNQCDNRSSMNRQASLDEKLVKSDLPFVSPTGPPQEAGDRNIYVFPVTFAQQRLWFLEQLAPGSNSYGILWPLRLTGPLDVAALEKSLAYIVRRHEILRTTFSVKDGEPVQVVADALPFELPLTDITSEEEARRLIAEESRRPFDLEKGPLFRGRLLRLSAADHVLILATHHIIFDGGSRRVLVRELSELYAAFREGKPSPLPNLPLQYADYAVWQRKYLQGANLDKQIDYWKHQLEGIPAAITLPTDRPRRPSRTSAGASRIFTFSADLTARLNVFAKQAEATLFMVLLAGFQALLSRYSGEDDIVVGTAIAGRNRLEIEGLIGFFANTLVLRTYLSGDPTVAELVSRVKEMALAAYAHQETPFEKLVEELQPERNISYNPVFQVQFALQSGFGRDFELPGLELKPLGGAEDSSKFDLSVFLTESPNKLSGRLEYNTDLFDEKTIDRIHGHWENVLACIVANPGRRISELPLLSEGERRLLLHERNRTASEYPRESGIAELFNEVVARQPDATAVELEGSRLSYAEL
ncbi:MAG: Malonyl CoA-acyl carrier protein transacylase, partial [Candidatus Sulfotelmatobacter sp.]|nr:Malonyl CoA-acyl carrier protein transacylase [Candidatus Sulfotelmatobacter sp.]